MIAYSYKDDTREYVGIQECQIDPLETKIQGHDVWLLPKNCTFNVPPEKQEGKAIVFENNAWTLKNDYRGKRAYNDNGLLVINYIGELHGSDKLLTQEQIAGINNGTLVWSNGQIVTKPEPSIEEQVVALEKQYGMIRWQREGILTEGSNYSVYTKTKAQQIEELAGRLRQ